MLDMKLVRQNPEKIRKMLKDRMVEFDLDLLLQLDENIKLKKLTEIVKT